MSERSCYRVIIIGGGIIGLTTACTILKEYSFINNLQLTIISERFSPDTTGDVSGGFWEPYGLNLNDPRLLKWAGYSYEIFLQEYFSNKAGRAGVIQLPAYILQRQENEQSIVDENVTNPPFVKLVRHHRVLNHPEVQIFNHLGTVQGFVMSSIVVEVRRYLPELYRFLQQDSRVKFIQRKISSLNQLKDQSDVVINCSGLGARDLVGDLTLRPARGQVIRINAPWIKSMYYLETKSEGIGYIIPQSEMIVLGGTFQLNDWNTTPTENDTIHIRSICAQILPSLKDIQGGQIQVGLRPYRDDGVRLEYEKTPDQINVIHCYGHSGSGITLSWGCARDVVNILQTLFPITTQQPTDLPEHEQLWRLIPENENHFPS